MNVRDWHGGQIALFSGIALAVAFVGVGMGAELSRAGHDTAGALVAVAVPVAAFGATMAVTWWWLSRRDGRE